MEEILCTIFCVQKTGTYIQMFKCYLQLSNIPGFRGIRAPVDCIGLGVVCVVIQELCSLCGSFSQCRVPENLSSTCKAGYHIPCNKTYFCLIWVTSSLTCHCLRVFLDSKNVSFAKIILYACIPKGIHDSHVTIIRSWMPTPISRKSTLNGERVFQINSCALKP